MLYYKGRRTAAGAWSHEKAIPQAQPALQLKPLLWGGLVEGGGEPSQYYYWVMTAEQEKINEGKLRDLWNFALKKQLRQWKNR